MLYLSAFQTDGYGALQADGAGIQCGREPLQLISYLKFVSLVNRLRRKLQGGTHAGPGGVQDSHASPAIPVHAPISLWQAPDHPAADERSSFNIYPH